MLVAALPFLSFDALMNVVATVDAVGDVLTSGTLVAMSRFLGGELPSSSVRWQHLLLWPLLLSSADARVTAGYPDTCSLRGSSCRVGLPSSQLFKIWLPSKEVKMVLVEMLF